VHYPCFSFEKLGPQRTIAKGKAERKEKSQKRPEKCRFFWERVEITAETAGCKRFEHGSGGGMGRIGAPFALEQHCGKAIAV